MMEINDDLLNISIITIIIYFVLFKFKFILFFILFFIFMFGVMPVQEKSRFKVDFKTIRNFKAKDTTNKTKDYKLHPSTKISKKLVNLLSKIQDLYIYSWYSHLILKKPSKFVEKINFKICNVYIFINKKVESVNWCLFVCHFLVPLFTRYFCQNSKKDKESKDKSVEERISLLCDQIIPIILESSNSNKSDKLAYSITSQIVAQTIHAILLIISDPDYINCLLDFHLSQIIHSHSIVLKMQKVIDTTSTRTRDRRKSDKVPSFEEYLKRIDECFDIDELDYYKSVVLDEIDKRKKQEKQEQSKGLIRYINKLNLCLKKIDGKLLQLRDIRRVDSSLTGLTRVDSGVKVLGKNIMNVVRSPLRLFQPFSSSSSSIASSNTFSSSNSTNFNKSNIAITITQPTPTNINTAAPVSSMSTVTSKPNLPIITSPTSPSSITSPSNSSAIVTSSSNDYISEDTVKLVEEAFQSIINDNIHSDNITDSLVDTEDVGESESGLEESDEVNEASGLDFGGGEYESILRDLEKNQQHLILLDMMANNQKHKSDVSIDPTASQPDPISSTDFSEEEIEKKKLIDQMRWQYEQERILLLSRKAQFEQKKKWSDNDRFMISIPEWSVSDDGKFVVYNVFIEVDKETDTEKNEKEEKEGCDKTFWNVWRRYSEFHSLHRSLRIKYGNLMTGVEFPGKRLIKGNLSGSISSLSDKSFNKNKDKEVEFREERRKGLEKFLKWCVGNEVVRKSDEVRMFLSDSGIATEGKGVFGGLREIPSFLKVLKDNFSKFGTTGTGSFGENFNQKKVSDEKINEMLFSTESFSRLVIEIFGLHDIWWRRQATSWIIQEVISDLLERKINESLEFLVSEPNLSYFIDKISESLDWDGVERSNVEKNETRMTAYKKFMLVFCEFFGGFVGRGNAKSGASKVFGCLQNREGNLEFLVGVFEGICDVLFKVR